MLLMFVVPDPKMKQKWKDIINFKGLSHFKILVIMGPSNPPKTIIFDLGKHGARRGHKRTRRLQAGSWAGLGWVLPKGL